MGNHHSASCLRSLSFPCSSDLRKLARVLFAVDVIWVLAHVLLHEWTRRATLVGQAACWTTLTSWTALNRTVCVAGSRSIVAASRVVLVSSLARVNQVCGHVWPTPCNCVSSYLRRAGHQPVHVLIWLAIALAILLLLSEAACSKCSVHLLSLLPISLWSTFCTGSHFLARWTSRWNTADSSNSGASVVLCRCVVWNTWRLQVWVEVAFLLVVNGLVADPSSISSRSCQSALNTLMLTQHGRWVRSLTTFCGLVVVPSAAVVARFGGWVPQLVLSWARSFLVNGWYVRHSLLVTSISSLVPSSPSLLTWSCVVGSWILKAAISWAWASTSKLAWSCVASCTAAATSWRVVVSVTCSSSVGRRVIRLSSLSRVGLIIKVSSLVVNSNHFQTLLKLRNSILI